MKLWVLPSSYSMSDVVVFCEHMPVKGSFEITGSVWDGNEDDVSHAAEWGNLAHKILIEDIMRKIERPDLSGVFYLQGWDAKAGEMLANYLSPELNKRTEGKMFEVISFDTGRNRIGLVGNE